MQKDFLQHHARQGRNPLKAFRSPNIHNWLQSLSDPDLERLYQQVSNVLEHKSHDLAQIRDTLELAIRLKRSEQNPLIALLDRPDPEQTLQRMHGILTTEREQREGKITVRGRLGFLVGAIGIRRHKPRDPSQHAHQSGYSGPVRLSASASRT